MADLASKNTDSVTKAFQAGLISQKVALKELRQQSELTGMWTNIGDEDIEKADDEVMSPDEGMGDMMSMLGSKEDDETTPTTDARWNPDLHPRGPNGEFRKNGQATMAGGDYSTNICVDISDVKHYNELFKGTTTSTGTTIKKVTGHAVGRIMGRKISVRQVKDILTSPDSNVSKGKTKNTLCFDKNNKRIVVDTQKGNIVSVMHRKRGKWK